MPAKPQAFKKTDTARMIRAARDAGEKITAIVLERGRVILRVGDSEAAHDAGEKNDRNEWDTAFDGNDQTKVR
jgi:hypothetical protein